MPSKRPDPNSARSVAFAALERVLVKGEFAAAALDDVLGRARELKVQDRGLATELTYGVLRTKGALEAQLNALAPRGIDKDVVVHLRLLIAAYELGFLDRVPDFASVNEAVEAVRALRGPKVAGFCNAVLRRCAALPKASLAEAVARSAPEWLRTEIVASVGEQQALDLLGASPEGSPRGVSGGTIRFRKGLTPPAWASSGSAGQLYPGALRFNAAGDLRRHPEFASGDFVIQDEGSMFAAQALGVRTGDKVLDACAGRGHKASFLAEQLAAGGELWVTDTAKNKLQQLQHEFERLKLPAPRSLRVDWSQGDDTVPRDFDRVLVDAPCTGSGTLRRRPEIALRLLPADVERLATLAESILRTAARHAKAEGRVLFVVCSVLERETTEVVRRVADVLESVPFDSAHPLLTQQTTSIHLLPGTHGCDGFFLASLRPKQAC